MDPLGGTNPKVDGYIRKNKGWAGVLEALRRIVLACGLVEEVKWRAPCYTSEGRNVVMLGAFKEECVISFLKGVLLKDPAGILQKPGEDSQAVRVVRFTTVGEVEKRAAVLKRYVREAMAVEKARLKVELKKIEERAVPAEFQRKLEEMPALKVAYEGLTPGRRRGYLIYFAGAKQAKTREGRVEKCVERILAGKGLED